MFSSNFKTKLIQSKLWYVPNIPPEKVLEHSSVLMTPFLFRMQLFLNIWSFNYHMIYMAFLSKVSAIEPVDI